MTGTINQPIVILGSGAMACLFAARLSAAGIRVRMLATWSAGLAALQNNGVCVEDAHGLHCYPVEAGSDPSAWGHTHLALVLVKSHQTARAADQLSAMLAADGLALTLQNGLGNAELLQSRLGAARVAVGVTTLGAAITAPGKVRATGSGEIILGQQPRLSPLRAAFEAAGLPVRLEADMQTLLWGKLVINAAVNPISAVLKMSNSELLTNPAAWQLVSAAAREAAAVAAAHGIPLPYPDPIAQVQAILKSTANNRSSMLQDIERGAPTEIEAITGALIQAGAAAAVDTPINWTLLQLVRALQNTQES